MANKRCPEGQHWDNLLKTCISWSVEPKPKPQPPAEPLVAQLSTKITTAKASTLPSVLLLSQTLWICVVLVMLGSILVLILWFVIFRQQTRVSSNHEDPGPEQEFLQKTEPPNKVPSQHSDTNLAFQRGAETPSPCHQLHPRGQTEPQWEDGFTVCRGPACSAVADHRVPLPATELEGTVLVTTKTL